VTYTPIRNLRAGGFVNIIGIIVSGGTVNPPKGQRPGKWKFFVVDLPNRQIPF
jgi:hypothetical protein